MPDSFASLGGVSARCMFGRLGLFLDGRIFGLVADGVLHFKADEQGPCSLRGGRKHALQLLPPRSDRNDHLLLAGA
ncbi:MAG: TfoX/Sxy family protein [Acetobacterales bacterium]